VAVALYRQDIAWPQQAPQHVWITRDKRLITSRRLFKVLNKDASNSFEIPARDVIRLILIINMKTAKA